jgi:hypothetical protein
MSEHANIIIHLCTTEAQIRSHASLCGFVMDSNTDKFFSVHFCYIIPPALPTHISFMYHQYYKYLQLTVSSNTTLHSLAFVAALLFAFCVTAPTSNAQMFQCAYQQLH